MALMNFNIFASFDANHTNAKVQIDAFAPVISSMLISSGVKNADVRKIGGERTVRGITNITAQVKLSSLNNTTENLIQGAKAGSVVVDTSFNVVLVKKLLEFTNTGSSALLDISVPITQALSETSPGLVTEIVPATVPLTLQLIAESDACQLYRILAGGEIAINATGAIKMNSTLTTFTRDGQILSIADIHIFERNFFATGGVEGFDKTGKFTLEQTSVMSGVADTFVTTIVSNPLDITITKNGIAPPLDANKTSQIISFGVIPPVTTIRTAAQRGSVVSPHIHVNGTATNFQGHIIRGQLFKSYTDIAPAAYTGMTSSAKLTILNNTAVTITTGSEVAVAIVEKAIVTG